MPHQSQTSLQTQRERRCYCTIPAAPASRECISRGVWDCSHCEVTALASMQGSCLLLRPWRKLLLRVPTLTWCCLEVSADPSGMDMRCYRCDRWQLYAGQRQPLLLLSRWVTGCCNVRRMVGFILCWEIKAAVQMNEELVCTVFGLVSLWASDSSVTRSWQDADLEVGGDFFWRLFLVSALPAEVSRGDGLFTCLSSFTY